MSRRKIHGIWEGCDKSRWEEGREVRSTKEVLAKRSENQDNLVCEKSAEDYCGHHGPSE